MTSACDIDKLRDLIVRQELAKHRRLGQYGGESRPVDPLHIERQLNTYLSQGITVAALTKCVEAIEREGEERVRKEREKKERYEVKQRLHTVCANAILLAEGEPLPADKHSLFEGKDNKGRKERFIRECKKAKEGIGDPWDA